VTKRPIPQKTRAGATRTEPIKNVL
jgi:hypothetical protein